MALTNVPPPNWNPATGFQSANESAILAGAQQDIANAFGNANLNVSLNTPQGQLASSLSGCYGNAQDTFCFFTTQTDPAYAVGRMQDAIGRIYFLERNGAQSTVISVLCSGGAGVVIPPNAQVIDESGNLYSCVAGGTISGGGTVTLPFAANVPGPTAIPTVLTIYTVTGGWDSASVSSGTVGTATETRAAFEARRQDTVEANAIGIIGSIIGAIAKVSGVLDYFGMSNNTSSPITVNGVTIAANAIYICVTGGANQDVANAILTKKPPGIPMTGNTSVTAYDSNPLYVAPIAYTIKFQRPSNLSVLYAVDLVPSSTVPANAQTLIQNAIYETFIGETPGISRARTNSLLLASTMIPVVQALGTWAQVRTLFVGSSDNTSATFNGSISGTALTVSAVVGTISAGQTLFDAGGLIPPGTTIVSGSGSSWVISASIGTISSEAMSTAIANLSSVQVGAGEEPTLYQANVAVTVA